MKRTKQIIASKFLRVWTRCFVLLHFVLITGAVLAQSSMFSEVDSWSLETRYEWDPNRIFPQDVVKSVCYFSENKIIEDTLYSVFVARQYYYKRTDMNGTHVDSSLYPPIEMAYFYDDTLSGITYMRMPDGKRAFPRYFHNPNVGDTIAYHVLWSDPDGGHVEEFVVDSILDIELFGKEFRKVSLLSERYYEPYYIVGVGGPDGVVDFLGAVAANPYVNSIRCISDGVNFEGIEGATRDCYNFSTIDIISATNNLHHPVLIYPNPVDKTVKLKPIDQLVDIRIVNSAGVEKEFNYSNTGRADQDFIIDVGHFSSGQYYVIMTDDAGRQVVWPFLKR